MTKKTRTILFLVCLFLFLLAAPSVVLYSQGYRIDFDSKRLTQTGGLFLKVFPKQVKIYLDEELKKRTDFFFSSVLIENLLPKKYKIEVKKEGYLPWEKTLEIREKEVTEVKNVILFPENPDFSILVKDVKDFWFSPDQKKIILKESDGKEWVLKLYEIDKNIKSYLISEKDISPRGGELLSLEFSEDQKKISLEIEMTEQVKYFSLEVDKTPPVLNEEKAPLPPLENVVAYQKVNNDVYYLDNFGYLFRNGGKLTSEAFPVKQETKYILRVFSDFIFLQEDKNLYKLNSDLKSFEKFFDDVQSLKISPDSQKLVYFSDYEIWILFLRGKVEQPQKKAGERLFLIRLSQKINDVFWLNSDYLVFNTGDKIKISEIDERDKINVIDIAELKNPEIFWNKIDKRLYILSGGGLYRSRVFLP